MMVAKQFRKKNKIGKSGYLSKYEVYWFFYHFGYSSIFQFSDDYKAVIRQLYSYALEYMTFADVTSGL